MFSYSPSTIGRSGASSMPSELVGVAGFEPAASSSGAKYRGGLPASARV